MVSQPPADQAGVTPQPAPAAAPNLAHQGGFLVCGLGSLGQHCVANLKTFGVQVNAVNLTQPQQWEVPRLPQLIDQLVIGDCRYREVLEQAGIQSCRAVLLVTSDERINLEAALTARVLNPAIRVVMRSEKQNLNALLSLQLANLAAFEPTELAAPAFALEAFGDELIGFFRVEDQRFEVRKRRVKPESGWRDRYLHQIETRRRRILRHLPFGHPADEEDLLNPYSPSSQFYTWLPNTRLRQGDEVVVIEADTERQPTEQKSKRPKRCCSKSLNAAAAGAASPISSWPFSSFGRLATSSRSGE